MTKIALTFEADTEEADARPLILAAQRFAHKTMRTMGYTAITITITSDEEKKADKPAGDIELVRKGGGYWDVVKDGEVIKKIKGKAVAEAWVRDTFGG